MTSEIFDRDWKVLLDGLERGNCIALLGPNVSTTDANGGRRNLATALSRHLASILESEEEVRVEDPDNLPLVAQIFSDRKTRSDLEVEVKDFYNNHERSLGNGTGLDAFENLAALPFPLFISVRHDRTLDHFLRARGRLPVSDSYNFKGDRKLTLGELGSASRPLVYQLLGSTLNPGSLALTESDLLDVLETLVSGNPGLPADLRNQFKEKGFLFLGCGLHRYYLRVLLHVLGLSRSGQRSFALETVPAPDDRPAFLERIRESVWFYRIGYRTLKLVDMDDAEFVKQLRERWEANHPGGFEIALDPKPHVSAAAPKVFVSYMKEDKPRAAKLVASFREHGIEPWIDINELTVGANWEVELEDAIGKEVDFFIALLSSSFGEDVETYVHREISEALKRKSLLGATKFIYPLMIDADAPLPKALDRAKIQAAPVGDVSDLVADIRRQFAKRRRRQS